MSWPSISALTAGISRSAWMQAFTKKPMKPSLTPWRFSNSVLVLVAQLHDRAHVHVVERGEHGGGVLRVLEAPGDGLAQARHVHALLARRIVGRRRRAHLLRRAPARSASARRRRLPARGRGRCAGSAAAATSSLSTWPRRPVPCTSAATSPVSSIILRAAGAGGMLGLGRCGRAAARAWRRGARPRRGWRCRRRRLRPGLAAPARLRRRLR